MSGTDWVSNLKINDVFHWPDGPAEYTVTAVPGGTCKTYRVVSSGGIPHDFEHRFIRLHCERGPLEERNKDWSEKVFDATTFEEFAEAQLCDFPASVRKQVYDTMRAAMTLAYKRGRRDEASSRDNKRRSR